MIVYYSSASGNTKRFVEGLDIPALRILNSKQPKPNQRYILVMPTFADTRGGDSVPKPVINFLNDADNRKYLHGVIGTGNRNFGEMFAIGGKHVARKCNVDLLYAFELSGTQEDADKVLRLHQQMEQADATKHYRHFTDSENGSLLA